MGQDEKLLNLSWGEFRWSLKNHDNGELGISAMLGLVPGRGGCPKAEGEWPSKFVPLFEMPLHFFFFLHF